MHILLINTNPVVSRLMKLCVKEEHARLDEVSSLDHIKSEPYDIVFIDDILFNETSHDILQRIDHNKLVLFSAQKDIDVPSFIDEVIKKPFLPSRVIAVIENASEIYADTFTPSIEEKITDEIVENEEENDTIFDIDESDSDEVKITDAIIEEENSGTIFDIDESDAETLTPSSDEVETTDETVETEEEEEKNDTIFDIDESDAETSVSSTDDVHILDDIREEQSEHKDNILDISEIEKIKSLLESGENKAEDEPAWEDEQELEKLKREVIKQNLIDEGLEIVEEDVLNAIEPDLNVNITHDIDDASKETFEKELLKAVQKMKIKKLKKLLKGAQITINIRFKDDDA